MKTHAGGRFSLDFLAVRSLRAVLRQPLFPLVLQLASLVALVGLAVLGWGIGADRPGSELMTLRKTNLTTLVVWGLWWPGMIALALILGHAWCAVCPMELVNRAGDALARRGGWRRARLRKWLRAGWLVIAAYLLLQLLVAGLSIHRVPHYTSLMLLALLATALLAGLAFSEPRSFCKGFCPVRALLSVYGRYTPVQLDVRDPEVCAKCETRDCVHPDNRYKFDGRSCQSLLRPYSRQQGDSCVLCFQCAKVCPYENIGFGFVKSAAGVRRHRLLQPFEAVFVMFASGFVAHDVIGEVKWLDEVFHAPPRALNSLAPSVSFGWFEAAWFLGLFPLLLWLAAAAVAYLVGCRHNIKTLLLAATTGAAPVVAVAHVAKATAKVTSWGGFFPLATADPYGLETLQRLTAKTMTPPTAWVSLSTVGWMMLLLLAVVAWRSLHWTKEASGDNLKSAYSGFGVTAAFYTAVLCACAWY